MAYTLLILVTAEGQQLADIHVIEGHGEAVARRLLSLQGICYMIVSGVDSSASTRDIPIQKRFLCISFSMIVWGSGRIDGGRSGLHKNDGVLPWNGDVTLMPHGTVHRSACPADRNDCRIRYDLNHTELT